MSLFFDKLRIGEKLGLGFGLVGVVFVAVIWQYHRTLDDALREYRILQEVHTQKKTLAQSIAADLLAAGKTEKTFLLTRDEGLIPSFNAYLDRIKNHTGRLGKIDEQGAAAATQIAEATNVFGQRFLAIAEAMRTRGLDHNSGLEGAFRDTVHRLEDLAARYQVSPLYISLLQIRRAEKDMGLRREAQYAEKARRLLDELRTKTQASGLASPVKEPLLSELATYRSAFDEYAERVLANEDIGGGKGPFRDAAHRIEDLLATHYIPDMEAHVLQIRRREKDYLLRGDKRYVEMVDAQLAALRQEIEGSDLPDKEKAGLDTLLADYRRDFLALVAQNDLIARLEIEMQAAAQRVEPLAAATVSAAEATAERVAREVNLGSARDALLMLWIAILAAALGVGFWILITRRITVPVLQIAGFLDRLAYEEPVDRIATVPGSRDEINAMAESVNQMAEHKAKMLAWWKASLAEMEAEKELSAQDLTNAGERAQERELEQARSDKGAITREICEEVDQLIDEIGEQSAQIAAVAADPESREVAAAIFEASKHLKKRLSIVSS